MPITKRGLYLDHAAAGVLPQPVADAMTDRIQSAMTQGVRHWNRWQKMVQRTRKLAAELIGGRSSEIAFVPNTAAGIGTVAEGFQWQSGDNVVLSSSEFPSNRLPWLNLQRRGVEVRAVNTTPDPDGFLTVLNDACDQNTRIVACSWIDYETGVRRDPTRLSEMAHRHGALLVLDVIQGIGVLPVDLHAQDIDVLVADSRKWLLGPEGAGVLAIREDVQDRFDATRVGWASTADPMAFEAPAPALSETATRFESGMHNTFGLVGLHASLTLFRNISPHKRKSHLLEARSLIEDAGRSAGLISPKMPQAWQSGIVCFEHPGMNAETLIRHLRNHNVTVNLKNNRVRVSPHVYNNESDAAQFHDAVTATGLSNCR
jgi:cysteine desulfurase/selenocysteine lyase